MDWQTGEGGGSVVLERTHSAATHSAATSVVTPEHQTEGQVVCSMVNKLTSQKRMQPDSREILALGSWRRRQRRPRGK